MTNFVEIGKQTKYFGHSCNFQKTAQKENNHPRGENSPNLATLLQP
jgi:hypothetical protein